MEGLFDWSWDPRQDKFNKNFKALVSYVRKEGTSLVPYNYIDEDGIKLGAWVSNLKHGYKGTLGIVKSKRSVKGLSKEHIKLFEDLPDWSW